MIIQISFTHFIKTIFGFSLFDDGTASVDQDCCKYIILPIIVPREKKNHLKIKWFINPIKSDGIYK